MFLVLPHFDNDLMVARRYILWDVEGVNQLQEVVLERVDQAFEEVVVVCLIFARWKSAVY